MAGLNKSDQAYSGDFGTPEQEIPATGMPGVDWESCMTMNDTWGFRSDDQNWKSTESLIRNIIDIASKGGNYLLNIGPTAEGQIPAPSVERLAGIGAWMKKNGESIYGTQASPFAETPWGRCTQKTAAGRQDAPVLARLRLAERREPDRSRPARQAGQRDAARRRQGVEHERRRTARPPSCYPRPHRTRSRRSSSSMCSRRTEFIPFSAPSKARSTR